MKPHTLLQQWVWDVLHVTILCVFPISSECEMCLPSAVQRVCNGLHKNIRILHILCVVCLPSQQRVWDCWHIRVLSLLCDSKIVCKEVVFHVSLAKSVMTLATAKVSQSTAGRKSLPAKPNDWVQWILLTAASTSRSQYIVFISPYTL